MDQAIAGEARPALTTYEDLAQRVSYDLTDPVLTDEQVAAACQLAINLGVLGVTVRPCDVELAVRMLDGCTVTVGSSAGFPHGSQTTAVKIYETRDLLRRGAKTVDLVLNLGRMAGRQFQFVETEVLQIARACHESGATLKVTAENGYLAEDLRVIAYKICKRGEADVVRTSTGYGPSGRSVEDLRLMKRIIKDVCRIEASGIATLQDALEAYEAGADLLASVSPRSWLDEWQARVKQTEGPEVISS